MSRRTRESVLVLVTCITVAAYVLILPVLPYVAGFGIAFTIGLAIRVATGIGRDPRP